MATYVWTGRTRTGEDANGEIEAKSEAEVINKLRAQNIQPSKVKKKAAELKLPFAIGGGVSNKELVIFTRQFATMIDAGLPLVQCLDILANGEPNKSFQRTIYAVKAEVEQGSTFASALNRHPRVFDELYVNLVAAGEVGGILDSILNRLAIYIEKSVKTARKVKGAFTYPIAILVVAVLVVALLLWKVIPTFQDMFTSMGNNALPKPTQIVINISDWFGANWYLVIGGIVAGLIAFRAFYNSAWGRNKFDAFMLRTPVFGTVIKKAAVAKFTRTLGTLVSAGVPILDGLEIVSRTAGNRVIERSIMKVRDKISEGRTMAEPLAEANIFPSMVVQMIGVGEATGAMDTMLNKIADFYEEEVDVAVDALTSLLEPMMMVFIGGIVGGMLIAMYLPIFSVADNVG
ncbi:MAG: type II secretion system F family protein [Myxococcales bacterium]|nr:type II secretion system F family protein [Myxococcales bacterium]MCB9521665.1 type II secretion system F family protein [Myxococcales bacterium]